ncbi:hypothetical protein GCM10009678_74800 [Actinomadura kijaniata]
MVLGAVAGAVLDRARWAVRRPAVALACWAGALTGTVASLAGFLLLAAVWPPAPGHGLLDRLHDCLPGHAHAGLPWASVAGVALLGLCGVRLRHGLPRLRRTLGRRRRHREMLNLVAREDGGHPDVLLLDHPLPVAYCLPSPHRPIVVSSGARERLDADQLAAVLAHERAHLRQRHHLLLLFTDLVHSLLPWSPTARRARVSVPPLLEMAADDAAARRCGTEALAEALRQLALLPGPAGALAAAPSRDRQLGLRLARLAAEGGRPRRGFGAIGVAAALCAAAGPLALTLLALLASPFIC